MSIRRSAELFSLAVLLGAALISPSYAGTISLAWSPVDHPDLEGYRVYFDTVQNAFGSSVDAGASTAVTLSGLDDCVDYQVAVKAYDSTGVESVAFSNAVLGWARPTLSSATPAQVERGSSVRLVLAGSNFQPGAAVSFSNLGVTVQQVIYGDCGDLSVDITVDAAASVGPIDVRVVNPDQVFGSGAGLVTVSDDGTGPGISSVVASTVGPTTATIGWQTDEPSDSQVFYRLEGEVSYQATPRDDLLVTDHQVELQGLAPESTYEFYVQSTDAAGNSTVSGAPQTFATQSSPYTYIRFEAEAGQVSSPIVVTTGGAEAFESAWIEVEAGATRGTPSDPAGTSELAFHLPHTAVWSVWVRVHGTTLDADAWFESVDGAAFNPFWPPELGIWQWVQVRPYNLGAGLHVLTLGGIESGTRADRILITDDPLFVPTEQPGDDVTPPDGVTDLAAVSDDGVNQLSWTNPAGESGLRVVIRYRTDGQTPISPADGLPLHDAAATAGGAGAFDHTGLTNGTTYSYSVFMVDPSGNASAPATVHATPSLDPPGTVGNLVRTDKL